jgi:oxygen-independent coproporphyrinogen-3 oxidase
MKREIGLYLHIPFCVRKCAYCDFLSFAGDEDLKSRYGAALIREIRGYAETAEDVTVSSVFMGGGTPSVLPARILRSICEAVTDTFDLADDAEITMEINPGTLNDANLSVISDYVNRVSLGVQSFDDGELKRLGRIHTSSQAVKSAERLRQAGIRNLNLDLMSGIPGQTGESWERTLLQALSLMPEHISAYSLIVEEGTPFFRMKEEGTLCLPDEETERAMYYRTKALLSDRGYLRYEISNYAKEGYRCRHNLKYWRRVDYLGMGLGASSLMNHMRWRNTDSMTAYLEHSRDPGKLVTELERLDKRQEIEEFMFLGLRLFEGVSAETFLETFGLSMTELYGDLLSKLEKEGLIFQHGSAFSLTDRGVDISNRVLSQFLLDEDSQD